MPGEERQVRVAIGRKRLVSVLSRHVVATMRTLEQKISDAGPGNQRIDPHILTESRQALEREGVISSIRANGIDWYYLTSVPSPLREQRLVEQRALLDILHQNQFSLRMGQTLEIAIYRSLLEAKYPSIGSFADLSVHDDSTMYTKAEPPSILGGKSIGNKSVDFVLWPNNKLAAIEAKNVREWFYPQREAIKDFVWKSAALDAVPILIVRRMHYSTFVVFRRCGVIFHQTYSQLYPDTDIELAHKASDKDILGFHDIKTGNIPDTRMVKFITESIPHVIDESYELFQENKDLLLAYGSGDMSYKDFTKALKDRDTGGDEFDDLV